MIYKKEKCAFQVVCTFQNCEEKMKRRKLTNHQEKCPNQMYFKNVFTKCIYKILITWLSYAHKSRYYTFLQDMYLWYLIQWNVSNDINRWLILYLLLILDACLRIILIWCGFLLNVQNSKIRLDLLITIKISLVIKTLHSLKIHRHWISG